MSNQNRATDPAVARRYRSKARYNTYRKPAKAAARRKYQPKTERMSKQLALKIPECSVHYIQALFDPFDTPAGVCIPADSFPLPSQKVKSFQRGTFNLGTTGYGFIAVAPAPWSDVSIAWTSTDLSVGNASTIATAYTNIGLGANTKLPFNFVTDALANKSVQARVVAAGLRIRYSGTEDNRQGLYVAHEDQDLGTTIDKSYNDVRDINQSASARPSGDGTWDQTVCYSGPSNPGNVEFTQFKYPLSNNLDNNDPASFGTWPMIIYCQGGAAQAIEFEICTHIEYIGSKVQGKTKSHADSVTYGKVLETVKDVSAIKPIAPKEGPSAFQRFIGAVQESLPQIVDVGMSVASALATRNPMAIAGAAGSIGKLAYGQSQPRLTQRQLSIMA